MSRLEAKPCATCGEVHCYWCGQAFGKGARSATREHLIPKSHGGGGGENIVVACFGCNSARGSSLYWVPFHVDVRQKPRSQWLSLRERDPMRERLPTPAAKTSAWRRSRDRWLRGKGRVR